MKCEHPQAKPPAARVLLALGLLGVAACGIGQSRAVSLAPPTVDTFPAYTKNPNVPLTGGRPANTEVWAVFADGVTQFRLATAGASAQWSGTLGPLQEGPNSFKLVAVLPAQGQSSPTNALKVTLLTVAPSNPVVYAPGAVTLNAGQASVSITIYGTKSPAGDITFVSGTDITKNPTEAVVADGNSTWQTTVNVAAGSNTYTFQSTDPAGNQSGLVTITIKGVSLVGPTINASSYHSPTNVRAQLITGTKPTNTDLYIAVNNAAPQAIGSRSSGVWSFGFNLSQVGDNFVEAFVTYPGVADPNRSGSATALIVYESIAPPTITSPAGWPNLADTGNSSLTIAGTTAANTYVCISNTSQGPCIATSSLQGANGGAYSVAVPLQDAACDNTITAGGNVQVCANSGSNALYVSARDNSGNISFESEAIIYRDAPPVIGNVSPNLMGSVILNPALNITFTAAPYSGDVVNSTVRPSAALQSVQVCLDTVDCQVVVCQGTQCAQSFNLSGAANGSQHTVTITVTDAAGAQSVYTGVFQYSNGAPFWVSDTGADQTATAPRAAFDSQGNLHVVWQDTCAQVGPGVCNKNGVVLGAQQIPPDIFYRRRDTTGAWGNIVLVSSNTNNDGHSVSPAITVDGSNTVHVAWSDDGSVGGNTGANYGIVHRTIANGGATLGTIDVVSKPVAGVDDAEPSLAADLGAGIVHASYTHKTNTSSTAPQYDIYYARFSGGAWSTALQVTNVPGAAGLSSVAAAASARANIAYQNCITDTSVNPSVNYCNAGNNNAVNYDIFLAEVQDAATLGFKPVLVTDSVKSTGQDGDSRHPWLMVDPSNLAWVFWDDNSTLDNQTRRNIWLRRYVSGGTVDQSFGSQGRVVVSDDPAQKDAYQPSVSLNSADPNGHFVVAWSSTVTAGSNTDISAKGGTLGLGLDSTTQTIYSDPGLSILPSIALNPTDGGGNLHVVWDDTSSFSGGINSAGNDQIFYLYAPKAPN